MSRSWVLGAEGSACRTSPLAWVRKFLSPGRLLLVAVGSVVVVVSLPLLRSLALRSNELDALRALDLLGREAFAADDSVQRMGDLFRAPGELAKRMPDTRLLAGGEVIFHHGYLFDLVPTESGGRVLRAWPLSHGETGLGAFTSLRPGQFLGHPNRSAAWSGLGGAPTWPIKAAEWSSTPAPPAAALPTEVKQPVEETGWRPVRLFQASLSGM